MRLIELVGMGISLNDVLRLYKTCRVSKSTYDEYYRLWKYSVFRYSEEYTDQEYIQHFKQAS